jgi:hypothetical protein
MLGEVAWAIARTKDKYLSALYHRVARRRGNEIAIMALAHKVLAGLQLPAGVIAWVIALVVAYIAHGLSGQDRAYLEQTR